MFNLKEMLKNFIDSSKRILTISKKPAKDELKTMLKVTGLGIIIIGVMGYIVSLVFFVFILPR